MELPREIPDFFIVTVPRWIWNSWRSITKTQEITLYLLGYSKYNFCFTDFEVIITASAQTNFVMYCWSLSYFILHASEIDIIVQLQCRLISSHFRTITHPHTLLKIVECITFIKFSGRDILHWEALLMSIQTSGSLSHIKTHLFSPMALFYNI